VATLQAAAVAAGLGGAVVTYEVDRGFVVTVAGARVFVGRFEVVAAWVAGYAAGAAPRPAPAGDYYSLAEFDPKR